MANDIEDKLAELQVEYQKKIPVKTAEIVQQWQNSDQTSASALQELHDNVLRLHGSAYTYGYTEVGRIAATLENLTAKILENMDELSANRATIEGLLKDLVAKSASPTTTTGLVTEEQILKQPTTIHLLVDMNDSEPSLPIKLSKFGYKVNKSIKPELFLTIIQEQPDASLVIDLNAIDDDLENFLVEQNNKGEKRQQIIFMSSSGEFKARLRAVRMGARAFLTKPMQIEDLITHLSASEKDIETTPRILIIEDDEDVATYTSLILAKARMQTKIIIKSSEIDKALHEFNPDLILLDINMPECNGLELAAIIRQQSLFESTPIIFLSSESNVQKQLNAMRIGADDFVMKETAPNVLVQTIKNRISRYLKLNSLLVRDNLTGHFNHSFIMKILSIKIKEAMSLHNQLTAALLHVDKLKHLNDTYGHQAGDQVVKSLALMLKTRLRTTDIVGRFNGANFLIVLPNTGIEASKEIIEDLRKQFLSLNYNWNGQIFNASFTGVLAGFPQYHGTDEIIEAIENKMEATKKEGTNRVVEA